MLFDPNLGEEGIGAIVAKVEDKIKSFGAELGKTEKWGTKRLASMILKARKLKSAYYVLIYFKAEPSVPGKVQSFLKITEEIVRHSLILAEAKPQGEIEGTSLVAEPGIEVVNVGEIKDVSAGEGSGES